MSRSTGVGWRAGALLAAIGVYALFPAFARAQDVSGPSRSDAAMATIGTGNSRRIISRDALERHVGQRIISLSRDGPVYLSQVSAIRADVLEHMIDELVCELFASQNGIEISEAELRSALVDQAKWLGLTVDGLYRQARYEGYGKEEFDTELRHRMRDQRIERLFIVPAATVSRADVESDFSAAKALGERVVLYRVAEISLLGLSAQEQATRVTIADSIAGAVRAGKDLCSVTQQSIRAPAPKCHSREQLTSDVPPQLRSPTNTLGPRVVGPIVRVGDSVAVVHVVGSMELSPFNSSRTILEQRVQRRALERAKAAWLAARKTEYGVERLADN